MTDNLIPAKDKCSIPTISSPNTSSSGLSWSTTPNLGDHFELVIAPDADEGIIRMKVGKAVNALPETEYTVKCMLAIPGGREASQETKVKVVVTQAT